MEALRSNSTTEANSSIAEFNDNDTVTTIVPTTIFLTTILSTTIGDINMTTPFSTIATTIDYGKTVEILPKTSYILIYTILIILSIVLITARSLLFYQVSMSASRNLHNTMFANILQATMRFFDTNPSGRILNRFSKDMGAIDEQLPKAVIDAIQIFLVMAGILIMVFIVTPWMAAVAIVLGVLFYFCRVVYLGTAQDVKRLEGISMTAQYCAEIATNV